MIPPSRRLQKHIKAVTSENEYFADMEKRDAYLRGITECLESPFGVVLIKALEDIESNAYKKLYTARFKGSIAQAKAEIKTASYVKNVLMGYVYEKEAFENAMRQYQEMEQGENYDTV